jgi:exopolyphosphatase/guanosine-5'-triphosphate,3'-diphosphate pyrophosphatase
VRKAVIDVGSNSVLLVVEEQTPNGWNVIDEEIAVTALGEGTKATGLLGEEGMAATLRAIKEFSERARSLHAESVLAGVTMAARIASNASEFLDRAEAQGTPVFILSGEDEADLGFLAIADDPKFSHATQVSIIDPGGHSTELVTADRKGADWKVDFRRSFPVGTLGLRSTHFPTERIEPMQILRGTSYIDDLIGLAYRPGTSGDCFVLGATGTNLVAMRDLILQWDPDRVHGSWLGYEEISKAFARLAPMSDQERAAVPGLEPGRERTIHIGALILERFLFALRAEGCYVSVRGWRHALLERGLPSDRAGIPSSTKES